MCIRDSKWTSYGGIYVEEYGAFIVQNIIYRANIGIKMGGDTKTAHYTSAVSNYIDDCNTALLLQSTDECFIYDNKIRFSTTNVNIVSDTNSKFRGNYGFTTESSGTATISASTSSVTVTHGLTGIPTIIVVTPRDNIGSVWVSNRNETIFTINCSSAPSNDVTVDWYAIYKP